MPLERPAGVTKEFYTPEEMAAIIKRAAANETKQTTPGTTEDVHYDFSQFGLDRSQSALTRNLRTSLIVDPPDGKLPPMTPEAVRREAEKAEAAKKVGRWDSAQSNQLDDRCLIMVGSGPPMMDAAYNSNYHIVQSRDYVMILVEMIHDARLIPLDGRRPVERPSVDGRVQPDDGKATAGRRDDEPEQKNPFRGSTENMRVTERFTRVADDVIRYSLRWKTSRRGRAAVDG